MVSLSTLEQSANGSTSLSVSDAEMVLRFRRRIEFAYGSDGFDILSERVMVTS